MVFARRGMNYFNTVVILCGLCVIAWHKLSVYQFANLILETQILHKELMKNETLFSAFSAQKEPQVLHPECKCPPKFDVQLKSIPKDSDITCSRVRLCSARGLYRLLKMTFFPVFQSEGLSPKSGFIFLLRRQL